MPKGAATWMVWRRHIRRSAMLGLFAALLACASADANTNVTVSDAATTPGVVYSGGVYTFPGLAEANIKTSELNGHLAAESVTVNAVNGQAGDGKITIDGPTAVTWSGGTFAINTSGSFARVKIGALNGTGGADFTMRTDGSFSQSRPFTIDGNTTVVAASVDLSLHDNDFGSLALDGGPAVVTDSNGVQLADVRTAGNFTLTTTGDIGQTGSLNAAGGLARLDSHGHSIDLQLANHFSFVAFSGSDVALTGVDGLYVSGTATGPLAVRSTGGGILGNGTIIARETASFAAAGPIGIGYPSNDFMGTVQLATTGGADASVTDDNDLTLGPSTVAGDLSAIAGTRLAVPAATAITAGGVADLVTDADASTGLGSGGVDIGSGASIDPVGPLGVYTVRRSQNEIAPDAMLNGATFTPGPEFVNSATEVWNAFWNPLAEYLGGPPTPLPLLPFTIFYKEHDTVPPNARIDSGPADGAWINDSTPTFTFSADRSGATLSCALDINPAFAGGPCASPYTSRPLADGFHTFRVGAQGPGGPDPTPATRAFTVDTVAPDTRFDRTPRKKLRTDEETTEVDFRFSANEPGATFKCRLDGAAFRRCESPDAFEADAGPHRFLARAIDRAGNQDDTAARFDFTVKRKKKHRR